MIKGIYYQGPNLHTHTHTWQRYEDVICYPSVFSNCVFAPVLLAAYRCGSRLRHTLSSHRRLTEFPVEAYKLSGVPPV